MRDLGWLEGQTLLIDYRGANGKAERLDQWAGEIVASRPDVIVTGISGAAVAAKRDCDDSHRDGCFSRSRLGLAWSKVWLVRVGTPDRRSSRRNSA